MTLSLGPARLAALETDDSAHSLNWLTHGQLSPGSVSGPGRRDERRARHRDGCRAGTADFRWAVKAYTRAGADGDDFNLSCDGWAESWPGHRGLRSRHGLGDLSITECQPPFRVTARTHPSSILQSSGPGSGSGGQWLLRWGQGEDWLSTLTIGDSDGSEGPRHVLNTNWWWRRALWTWLELKYRELSPRSSRQFLVDRNKFRRQMSELSGRALKWLTLDKIQTV